VLPILAARWEAERRAAPRVHGLQAEEGEQVYGPRSAGNSAQSE